MPYLDFNDLSISTKTIQVYTNLFLDLKVFFENVSVVDIPTKNIPLGKKKKRPDIRKIYASPGDIISARRMHKGRYEFRGIVTRPEKNQIASLRERRDKGELKATEQEKLEKLEKIDGKNVLDFQNQICIIMNIGTRTVRQRKTGQNTTIVPINLNIMIFRNNFKIAGCKKEAEAYKAIRILWGELKRIGCYKTIDNYSPRFVVDTVMTNFDFQLGFTINRKKLNEIMNLPEYSSMICSSIFEPTSHTNVKIRMKKKEPQGWYDIVLVFSEEDDKNDPDGFLHIQKKIRIFSNPYKNTKNSKKKSKYHTFLVPRSGKVIVSGKYNILLEKQYLLFLDIIDKYRPIIQESIKIK